MMQRWKNRWEGAANGTQTLGWHIPEPHHALVKFLDQLLPGDREPTQTSVLFPLSGKSVDLGFLASVGYRVVGVEAVPLANTALLAGFGDEAPPRPLESNFTVRTALSPEYDNITVVEGDFCAYDAAANAQAVGRAHDAAFDRGALVAVRPEDREAYARALTSVLAPGARRDGRAGPHCSLQRDQRHSHDTLQAWPIASPARGTLGLVVEASRMPCEDPA